MGQRNPMPAASTVGNVLGALNPVHGMTLHVHTAEAKRITSAAQILEHLRSILGRSRNEKPASASSEA